MKPGTWFRPTVVVALVLVFMGVVRAVSLDAEHLSLGAFTLPDLCPWRSVGWNCPACGLTRSTVLLGRGAWAEAWSTHPGAFVLLGVAGLEATAMLWTPRARVLARWILAGLLIFLSFMHWHPWTTLW